MELKASQLGAWTINSPPRALSEGSACLVYGADVGGVTDLCLSLVKGENRVTIEAAEISYQAISAHTDTLSLFGGGASVLIRGATDKHVKDLEQVLDNGINPGSRIVVQAGALKSTSKLKKLFASHKAAQAVVLYLMRGKEISDFVGNAIKEQGLSLDRTAAQRLEVEVSGDRAVAARTAELLSLHAIGSGRSTVTREDVALVCDGVDESDLSSPLDYALQGRLKESLLALQDKMDQGENAIALIRIFSYRLSRYNDLACSGLDPDAAVSSARPPIFWNEKSDFIKVLGRFDYIGFAQILVLLDRTEHRIIEKGVKPNIALQELLISIAKGSIKWPA